MSRETDTPSSGPNGRGGAAYPSGTPPYGTPAVSDGGADAGRSAAQPEERKTETTLTTRIRINIPGSRPIPPVVVRKTVAEPEDGTGGARETGAATPSGLTVPAAAPVDEPPAEPDAPAEDKPTSDWFAPRKSGPAKAAPGGGSTNGAGLPGASGAPASGSSPAGSGSGIPGPSAPGGRPGGVVGSMNAPGGARPGGANGARPGSTTGAGLPGATGGPVAPGHGGGTGSFDMTEALSSGPLGGGSRSGGEARRDDLPYFAENERGDGTAGRARPNGPSRPGGASPFGSQDGPAGFGGQGPSGPTGGPVTGTGPMAPPPGGGRTAGTGGTPGHPGAGMSDDTAILTPQKPAPEGTPGYGPRPDNVSGHTVTSGIPVVPGGAGTPFAPGTEGAAGQKPPKRSGPSASAPRKKGRGKLPLIGGAVVVLAGLAYGAGLLMNHSDVPKGTTVLGVDIGGGTRDDAVKKLDDAFGKRVNDPLKLSVEGRTVTLRPDRAGLQFDTQATASAAAQSDYNPVSVIGSLFGNQRAVEPVMPVDEEKLQAALQSVSGGAGSSVEGTVKFEPGRAVPVYGKAGKGIDAAASVRAVEQAYRTEVETGAPGAVSLPTTTRQPTVPNAEVDRMMKVFAQPAMSGKVMVKSADGLHTVAFSPQKSLWKFLGVKAVDGKLVEYYDTNALKQLYGSTFDGVLITRGTGAKTAVTPQDVIGALRPALLSSTNRVGVIGANPN
ncbi:hypothetical protein [Streptomyces tropicalis]|uniref:Peptidoglycan binding domain-containing protein n=1 Tax=Streptomyces tropicalis TaxID=3034234 RepID=A0ABT6A091_9ACTN|nr:hypothetical protein [Streptomyces tropicalis]MDF3298063.1 hypothetical protein [Streptomyces tropicalis]